MKAFKTFNKCDVKYGVSSHNKEEMTGCKRCAGFDVSAGLGKTYNLELVCHVGLHDKRNKGFEKRAREEEDDEDYVLPSEMKKKNKF